MDRNKVLIQEFKKLEICELATITFHTAGSKKQREEQAALFAVQVHVIVTALVLLPQ